MLDIQKIKDIAISEVLSPTSALTQQLLSVNKIVYKDGVPVIEDIIFAEDDVAVVYFPIVDESYYFVAYVDYEPSPELRSVCMTAANVVELVVVSERHALEELTGLLKDIEFSKTWGKGETKRGRLVCEDSGFVIKLDIKKTGEVENKIQDIIKLLSNYKDEVRELSRMADAVEISIGYFGYTDQMWGIHLDSKTIQDLAELGVSLDIDLYASGPALPYED